jgi:hypothetical protein
MKRRMNMRTEKPKNNPEKVSFSDNLLSLMEGGAELGSATVKMDGDCNCNNKCNGNEVDVPFILH